jgi:hypothetical protein
VETIESYNVIVKKPDKRKIKSKLQGCKNQSDFTVWVFEPDGNYWMPKHYKTLEAFYASPTKNKPKLFSAIKDVVLNYSEPKVAWTRNSCQNVFMGGYSALLILSYLKWMATLEDTLFPPPTYLGRKMAFAGYVLVHSGLYTPNEIRRLLKIW